MKEKIKKIIKKEEEEIGIFDKIGAAIFVCGVAVAIIGFLLSFSDDNQTVGDGIVGALLIVLASLVPYIILAIIRWAYCSILRCSFKCYDDYRKEKK